MKNLSFGVAAIGLLAFALGLNAGDGWEIGLGVSALICAVTAYLSARISSYLKVFSVIFSIETIAAGLLAMIIKAGLWPAAFADHQPPDTFLNTFPITVAVFSILTYAGSHIGVLRQITRIADLYYEATERGQARVWPFPAYSALERRIAVGMVVFLVLVNQVQVGINVRLSFFGRDLFNAIQNKDESAFWSLLLFVFAPWAVIYIASAVIEFVVQSMLVIRWRRWLTEHFIGHWLGGHTHYRMSLVGTEADNWVIGRPAAHPMIDLPEYYQASDCLAQGSLAEGLGLSPLEALACGIPAVCTAVGGLAHLAEYARLTPRRDPAAMSRELLWMAANHEQAMAQAMRGREYVVRKWSREKAFAELAALFETTILHGRSASAKSA